jgi:putative tryptophan/tyrosine transport system substrate-binding protein
MSFDQLKRREFITLLGGATLAWPLAARAQQTMPVIGYLYEGSPEPTAQLLAAFRKGLSESGYVEERSVTIEFRWAQGQYDRLPELAAELVRRRVAVIVAPGGMPAAIAAKAATTTIPIVFGTGSDPVQYGLVASLSRPGGNVTGVSAMNVELTAKRLGLLHDLLPGAAHFAVLVNPNSPFTESAITDLRKAASSIGRQLEVLTASTNHDINAAFATLVQKRADALFINGDAFFTSRVVQLATLAVHHRVPTIYSVREFVAVGGLISYGASFADMFRQVGIYTGRILRGEKPAELPVLQATKFELVINAQTARMLGLTVPEKLLVAADEVIE